MDRRISCNLLLLSMSICSILLCFCATITIDALNLLHTPALFGSVDDYFRKLQTAVMCCAVEKRGRVYILTLTGADDHRLNPTLLSSIRSALAQIRADSALTDHRGTALVTTAQGRFFSNGLDLAWAKSSSSPVISRLFQLDSSLSATIADFISLPMPTICAVTGHAAAAGFGLALAHDYIVMRKDRGFLYMSEMDIGIPLTRYFAELVRTKIGDPKVRNEVVLKAEKLTGDRAMEMGIVDGVVGGNPEETVEMAVRLGEELVGKGWDGAVYAKIRMGLHKHLCVELGIGEEEESTKKSVVKSRL